ncbi:MAG: FadR family transcriptional regulator [Chloroflexi bacterium]|nr:FadR family transcriptional regulator [Chloroflexota bacterium]
MIHNIPSQRPLPTRQLNLESELLDYLAEASCQPEADTRIPALGQLSSELHVSVSKLREQLEVARVLGLVTVRPRTGIHRQEFNFMSAVRLSLFFALAGDITLFDDYSDLRKHVEMSFWHEAVARLTDDDKTRLRQLVARAWEKLRGSPVRIPHAEHREFHLTIFSKLDNVFVRGLLEAYWEAYEAVELNKYADLAYLSEVWSYHERITEDIIRGDVDSSLRAFEEHTKLLPSYHTHEEHRGNGATR